MHLPKTPSFSLEGRRAFVPGGSRGIGLACAVALAEAGADVTIAARSVDQVDAAVAAMRAEGLEAMNKAAEIRRKTMPDSPQLAETIASIAGIYDNCDR